MAKRRFNLFNWLRGIISRFFKDDESVFYTYQDMGDAMEKWLEMYYGEPRRLKKTHGKTLNLPAAISAEFARLMMVGFDVKITGSPFADFLNDQFKRMSARLRESLEQACAVGGFVLKPYVCGGKIMTDLVTQDKVIPVKFHGGECSACFFLSVAAKSGFYYWQLEKQYYDEASHTFTSKSNFFVSNSPDRLGKSISVDEFPFPVQEDFTLFNVDMPLFSFWRVPLANTIDRDSPLGVSVYSRAVKQIMEADKQWDRFLWEFEGGALAIDASEFALRTTPVFDSEGNEVKTELPQSRERLFRRINARKTDNSSFYEVFAPTLRDSSYSNGLNKIFRIIEFLCGLAYGTFSDLQEVDKTAEEVKASKQRSYTMIDNMQQSLQAALERYIYALERYAVACNLAPQEKYEVTWNWGDGVLEDTDKETQIRMQEVNSEIITKVDYLKWRYGVDKATALKMIPQNGNKFKSFFSEDES